MCLLLSVLLLGFAPALLAQSAEEKKETVAYLHSLAARGGGYRLSAKAEAPSLRATSSALRALKYFGGKPKDPEGCITFVKSCFDKETGGFADTPGGKPDAVLTAVGLMALVELKVPLAGYEEKAIAFMTARAKGFEEVRMAAAGLEAVGKKSDKNADWLAMLAKMQNDDGTFGKGEGKIRETGGAVAAVLRLGGKVKDRERVLEVLDAGQRKDGGFGKAGSAASDLETTYRVMRTYHMLEAQPGRVNALRDFIARCRNTDGGYGVAPDQPSSTGSTYFAAIVLHWLDSK